MKPAYEITIPETGEVYALSSRETFDSMDTMGKAEAFAQLKQFSKAVNSLVRELEPLMTLALHNSRPDPSKVVNIPTSIPGVTVCLPSGLQDKTLGKGEVKHFADELHAISAEAEKEIISYEPCIAKAAVNKWRTIPGPVAELILRVYCPGPKTVEIKIKEK